MRLAGRHPGSVRREARRAAESRLAWHGIGG